MDVNFNATPPIKKDVPTKISISEPASLKKEESPRPQPDVSSKKEEISKKEIKKSVEALNHFLKSVNSHVKFQYHEKLNEYYVSIVDNETEQVVREIPPKKMLDLVASIYENIGLIVDKKI